MKKMVASTAMTLALLAPMPKTTLTLERIHIPTQVIKGMGHQDVTSSSVNFGCFASSTWKQFAKELGRSMRGFSTSERLAHEAVFCKKGRVIKKVY